MQSWKKINFKGTEYICSNYGKITDINNKPLKIKIDKYGYEIVRLHDCTKHTKDKRIPKFLHRLIYHAFYPNVKMEGLTINHIDGNKINNNLDNLELISFADNNKHAYRIGLKNHKGESHPKSIFKKTEIIEIRKLYLLKKLNQIELAKLFNTTQPRISEIVKNKTWKNI